MNRLGLLLLIGIFFISCSNKRDYKNESRATGWKMIGRMGGFAKDYNKKSKKQETGPGLVYIEGGTFTKGRVQDDPLGDWNNVPTQQHVMSFYMDETEVTNLMYLEYLDWLKKVFPPDIKLYTHIYNSAVPDTLVWRNKLGSNETMVRNYLRHASYSEYPVVGVSWLQAVNFCRWRTDRVNEKLLEDAGFTVANARFDATAGQTFSTETYLASPTNTYGGNDSILSGGKRSQKLLEIRADSSKTAARTTALYVQRKDGLFLPEYRLPTESEWEYAAKSLDGLRVHNSIEGRKKYPWNGSYTRSGKRKTRGDQMANFKQGKGDYSGIAGWSDDNADITNKVKSYPANDYGLYDMAGNVSEWVADVYRQIIEDEENDFNYFRGNVYTKSAKNQDGSFKIVSLDSIIYDTIPNAKLVPRQLPGEILQVPIDIEETFLRINFSQSENRDYRDGDPGSRKSTGYGHIDENPMYNSPQNEVFMDSSGTMIRSLDKNTRTSLISNNTRVYKGGSWRDGEYWLDPSQRRFMPEHMATDYIGFRCAMSRVGSKKIKKRKTRK